MFVESLPSFIHLHLISGKERDIFDTDKAQKDCKFIHVIFLFRFSCKIYMIFRSVINVQH